MNESREMLRHTVATVAYRGGKAIRGVTAEFAGFRAGETTRTPLEILGHIGDLFDWARELAEGRHTWRTAELGSWEQQSARFFRVLEAFDARLAGAEPLGYPIEKLFQGPVADALTHIGQIALLRRMAGCAVKGENYFRAEIVAGRAGAEQAPPRVEFD